MSDFESFRRWLTSGDFPKQGKICFIQNTVWTDLSTEELFTHGQVRSEIAAVLHALLKQTKFGRFAPEGTRYSNLETELSTEPDGMVISNAAIAAGSVKFRGTEKGGQTEVIGSAEVAIEVVSRSSQIKDREWAMAS